MGCKSSTILLRTYNGVKKRERVNSSAIITPIKKQLTFYGVCICSTEERKRKKMIEIEDEIACSQQENNEIWFLCMRVQHWTFVQMHTKRKWIRKCRIKMNKHIVRVKAYKMYEICYIFGTFMLLLSLSIHSIVITLFIACCLETCNVVYVYGDYVEIETRTILSVYFESDQHEHEIK